MKYTREEMYQSACNDSEKMFKLKALDYLEWLCKSQICSAYWCCIGSCGVVSIRLEEYKAKTLSEAIRSAIKEVCKS